MTQLHSHSTPRFNAGLQSPFNIGSMGHWPTATGQTGVTLRSSTLPSVTLISTWLAGMAPLESALDAALSCSVPRQTGQVAHTAFGLLMRNGPLEWMLIGTPHSGGQGSDALHTVLRHHVPAEIGSITDISHARYRIRVEGTHSVACLGKLFALDLRSSAWPVGEMRMGGTHHVPSVLHRLAPDRFDLYVWSTYAQDQLDSLHDAALEYGVEVGMETLS